MQLTDVRVRCARWLLLIACGTAAASGIEVVDDAGRDVSLPAPAQRIVSLAPHITELLFAAGAGDRVVGVSRFSDYPTAARDLPVVGGGRGLDLERILALQPDLVVAWQSGNGEAALQRLQELGLTVFYSEPQRVDAIAESLLRFGRLAGTVQQAAVAAAGLRREVAQLQARYAQRPVVTVFYQVWARPLMTVGGRHLISDWISLCGGRNVFAGLSAAAPSVTLEAVLRADPQVIVSASQDPESVAWQAAWQRWPGLRAVAGGHLYALPADLIARHTPRAVNAVRRLCEHLDAARS